MSDSHPHDSAIDAQLRAVPLPEGMLARLQQITALTDEQIDFELRDVPVPVTVVSRLSEVARYTDAEIDFQLRDVSVPATLAPRLRNARTGVGVPSVRSIGLAASVLIAIGLSYAAINFWRLPPDGPVAPKQEVAKSPTPAPLLVSPQLVPTVEDGLKQFAVDIPPYEEKFELASIGPSEAATPDVGTVAKLLQTFEGIDPALDVTIAEQGLLFGAEGSFDELKDLEVVDAIAMRGSPPPRVKQYDHLFEQRYGVHPFVDPSAHKTLERSRVPLLTETDSYDRLWQAVSVGRLSAPNVVLVEEFLAALDYAFLPPTDQKLGIRTAAGPAVFSGSGLKLLQVGVQAVPLLRAPGSATHLTVGVDVSGSMRADGRLEMVRRTLRAIVSNMSDDDRLSIVAFDERAEVLLENAPAQDKAAISAAISLLSPHGSTNLGEGIQVSAAVAVRAPHRQNVARQVTILTDGLAALEAGTLRGIEQVFSDAAEAEVKIHLVDLGDHELLDDELERFANATKGSVRRAASSMQLKRHLLEVLAGQPQLVAQDSAIEVAFNPKAVASYRLIGHEAQAGAGLLGGGVSSDIHAGQSATALYEVVLRPDGPDDVATATLTWRDPVTGTTRQLHQRISRLQFANSFEGSSLSLQMAAIGAEAAQVLRQSYFTPASSHSLDRVLEVALSANEQLQGQDSFQELIRLLEGVRKLPQHSASTERGGNVSQ